GTNIVTQTIATTVGVDYLIDFWLANNTGNGPNSANVLWDGATIGSLVNVPGTGLTYSHYSYEAVATASSTTVTFAFQNNPSYFLFDDVSVASVPDTESTFGTISFTDVDTIDVHTIASTPQGGGYLGTFTPTLTPATDTTGGQPGTVNWT